jgi:hypothetical protein
MQISETKFWLTLVTDVYIVASKSSGGHVFNFPREAYFPYVLVDQYGYRYNDQQGSQMHNAAKLFYPYFHVDNSSERN